MPIKENQDRSESIDIAGKDAALLSAIEIGLGSFLHSLRIPMSGQFLSLNQSFILSRTIMRSRHLSRAKTLPFIISNITACLKSLSPAGKKLTPMLAISTQGFLYNLGTLLLGRNILGMLLGAVLLSVWSFIQPLLLILIIFGKNIEEVAVYFVEKLQRVFSFDPEQILFVVLGLIGLKAFLAMVTVFIAIQISDEKFEKFKNRMLLQGRKKLSQRQEKLQKRQKALTLQEKAKLAIQDLMNPLFIISFLLMLIFFFYARTDWVSFIWLSLRPIAVGFILFFLIRVLPLEKILNKLENTQFKRFSKTFRVAIEQLKKL